MKTKDPYWASLYPAACNKWASVWPANAKLWSQVQVGFHSGWFGFRQRRRHVGRFDGAFLQMILVDEMNLVDKRQIPRVSGVEIVAKAPIDENIDDVAETDKEFKVKLLDQQGQDVLCPNALESFF